LKLVPVTLVVEVAELSASFGSGCVASTVAVFVSGLGNKGCTTKVIVAAALLARIPKSQRTTVVKAQLPWLGMAETKIAFAENPSVSVTFVASLGPLLVTVIVMGVPVPVVEVAGPETETAISAGVEVKSLTSTLRNM
jgi:hypothetical protein